MARSLQPYDLAWLEEPVWPPEDYAGLARVRAEGGVPISCGENAAGLLDVKAILDMDAVDIVQPSAAKIGGITEVLKIAALAEAMGVRLVPHCAYFGPGFLASLHLAAALAPQGPFERLVVDLETSPYHDLFDVKDGRVTVPNGPGLGRDPDLDVLRRYALSAPTVLRA
jgi:L-alanine-DL-glutamate epimerase-like enolase superfamily enzyme